MRLDSLNPAWIGLLHELRDIQLVKTFLHYGFLRYTTVFRFRFSHYFHTSLGISTQVKTRILKIKLAFTSEKLYCEHKISASLSV
jgi:hypothetical protein